MLRSAPRLRRAVRTWRSATAAAARAAVAADAAGRLAIATRWCRWADFALLRPLSLGLRIASRRSGLQRALRRLRLAVSGALASAARRRAARLLLLGRSFARVSRWADAAAAATRLLAASGSYRRLRLIAAALQRWQLAAHAREQAASSATICGLLARRHARRGQRRRLEGALALWRASATMLA